MTVQRFDIAVIKSHIDEDGFLYDTPIVGRVGVQEYIKADGTIRRELRLPEEVFNEDSLQSFVGKPITSNHPSAGKVTSKDAHRLSIGAMLNAGIQDGDNVIVPIVIHSPTAIGDKRELSLGYECKLDETAGVHPKYGTYDAIQRAIKIQHLSVVKKGRAGVARLNFDSNEILDDDAVEVLKLTKEQYNMPKIVLDSGIEYEAPAEVVAELTKLRSDVSTAKVQLEAIPQIKTDMQKTIDELQAKVDGIDDAVTKAKEAGRLDALNRLTLEAKATALKVDCKDKTDREIKEAVIKSVRKDADLADKSDVYVDAAFDMAIEFAPDANMASQREAVHSKTDSVVTTGKSAYQAHMDSLANKGDK